jgi:hypothetical protein
LLSTRRTSGSKSQDDDADSLLQLQRHEYNVRLILATLYSVRNLPRSQLSAFCEISVIFSSVGRIHKTNDQPTLSCLIPQQINNHQYITMSLFRTCLDGHRCENGSSCLQHPLEEGTYFCDCSSASGDFAGLFCEYQAETYCQLEQETSSTWFCVNQGTCVLETSGSAQYKCDCPVEYEGPVSKENTQE